MGIQDHVCLKYNLLPIYVFKYSSLGQREGFFFLIEIFLLGLVFVAFFSFFLCMALKLTLVSLLQRSYTLLVEAWDYNDNSTSKYSFCWLTLFRHLDLLSAERPLVVKPAHCETEHEEREKLSPRQFRATIPGSAAACLPHIACRGWVACSPRHQWFYA